MLFLTLITLFCFIIQDLVYGALREILVMTEGYLRECIVFICGGFKGWRRILGAFKTSVKNTFPLPYSVQNGLTHDRT
jgi:hypothetical protein